MPSLRGQSIDHFCRSNQIFLLTNRLQYDSFSKATLNKGNTTLGLDLAIVHSNAKDKLQVLYMWDNTKAVHIAQISWISIGPLKTKKCQVKPNQQVLKLILTKQQLDDLSGLGLPM